MKFTFSFLNLTKIHILIPKSTEGGRGPPVQELFLKTHFLVDLFPNANMPSLIQYFATKLNLPNVRIFVGVLPERWATTLDGLENRQHQGKVGLYLELIFPPRSMLIP